MPPLSIAVVGVGAFGVKHLRVINQSQNATLTGVLDLNDHRATEAAEAYGCRVFRSIEELAQNAKAAIVATPTITHSEIGNKLLDLGLDVLIEKPLAENPTAGRTLIEAARRTGRLLQVGLLERYNPAIIALAEEVAKPLFFEAHRLGEFTPRSLDVNVVLDLMIHDIDVILTLVGEMPNDIHATGISILTDKIDIANARLEFPGGCVANLTASRVHTERVRKLRLFQRHEYISLDYTQREVMRCRSKPPLGLECQPIQIISDEPLRLELEDFFACIVSGQAPRVTPAQALAALTVACEVLDKIDQHSRLIDATVKRKG